MDTTITRTELESLNYGRGADLMIRGARYAVITGTTAHPEAVRSTHRSYDAAVRSLRRIAQNTGRVHIAEIIS